MRDEEQRLTHVDARGEARMVDVGGKATTEREAEARGVVVMRPETAALIRENRAAKGDVLAVARVAGIMAAKRTSELIPLCHQVPLAGMSVEFEVGEDRVEIVARARTVDRTGVEMEALAAVSMAALTIYDMCKAVDRGMRVTDVRLTYKRGGRSGTFRGE
jgi:cyclic pyranopterin monophosphate synthase